MLTLSSLVFLIWCFLSTREATYAMSFIPISFPILKRRRPEKIFYLFIHMGKNCAVGLEYGSRPLASGRTQEDLGHSFFPYGLPPGK